VSLPLIIAAFGASGLVAALATPPFAALARARGLVVAPREDRWHRQATPLLGGAAIFLGVIVALAATADLRQPVWVVVVAGAFMAFALGLLDDFRHLAPATKLAGQALIGVVVVLGGVGEELIPFPPLRFLLTIFWIVALMNAINLMDNMDGLAAGIAAIAAIMLAAVSAQSGGPAPLLALACAGAALGFLIHNFSPARVFMGDAGSLLLGYLLAMATLLHTAGAAANVAVALIGPIVVLGLPIFDTLLVMTSRWWSGLPVSRGGRDHTSHRLASLGLSDRASVLLLYGVAAALGATGLVLSSLSALVLPLVSLAVAILALFAVFLLEVDPVRRAARAPDDPRSRIMARLSIYLRFGFEVGLDVILLTTAYYTAYVVRFEGLPEDAWLYLFVRSLPIVVGLQLAALVVSGTYRTLWRYLSIPDVVGIVRAITAATAVAAVGLLVTSDFIGYSRAVFVMDWLGAAALVVGSRAFLVWLSHWSGEQRHDGQRKAVIVGATDAGAAAVGLLRRASGGRYRAIGFLDEDPGKRYRRISGVRVIGTAADLEKVIDSEGIDVVVLATDDADVRQRVREACDDRGIECRDLSLAI
jgi:UDP-GlcNAc:undecaprenyl-phosphate GlcNAc-1-phosphate transferase